MTNPASDPAACSYFENYFQLRHIDVYHGMNTWSQGTAIRTSS